MATMSTEVKERHWAKKRDEAPMVQCACGCGEDMKSVDDYGRPKRFITGHNGRRFYGTDATPWAREKRWRVKNPAKMRDNKREFYRCRKLKAMALLGNSCRKCGLQYNGFNAPTFEFHHRDPSEKDDGITRMLINKAWDATLAELAKCDLLCDNCHNMEHGGKW